MKGVSEALWVVITAVVVLVVALIVLTMFGTGVTNVATLAQAKPICTNAFSSMCYAGAAEPSMWSQKTLVVNNVQQSCTDACGAWPTACPATGRFTCGT